MIINSDGERHDRYEYPLDALREAATNALIHRDYSTQTENSYISVTVYTDRIRIINPGNLYGTNRIDKLGTSTSMDVRNPNIIKILEEKSRVVENRHSGIPTVIREMKKHGLKCRNFMKNEIVLKLFLEILVNHKIVIYIIKYYHIVMNLNLLKKLEIILE